MTDIIDELKTTGNYTDNDISLLGKILSTVTTGGIPPKMTNKERNDLLAKLTSSQASNYSSDISIKTINSNDEKKIKDETKKKLSDAIRAKKLTRCSNTLKSSLNDSWSRSKSSVSEVPAPTQEPPNESQLLNLIQQILPNINIDELTSTLNNSNSSDNNISDLIKNTLQNNNKFNTDSLNKLKLSDKENDIEKLDDYLN